MTSTRFCAVAVAALLASTSYAAAFGINGGSVGLSYGTTNRHGPDIKTTSLDGNIDFGLTDKLSFGLNAAADNYNFDGPDPVKNFTGVGADVAYALTPAAKAGVYFETLNYDLSGSPSNFYVRRYGVDGSYALSPMTTLSAFYGRYDGDHLQGQNVNSYGLRADVRLTPDIGLYASYQQDHNDTFNLDVNKASIGGSYSLEGAIGQPVLLTAGYSDYSGTGGYNDQHEITVGAKYMIGGKGDMPTGFTGQHGILGSGAAFGF